MDRSEVCGQIVDLMTQATTATAHYLRRPLGFGRTFHFTQSQTMGVTIPLEAYDVGTRQRGKGVTLVTLIVPRQFHLVMGLQNYFGKRLTRCPVTCLRYFCG